MKSILLIGIFSLLCISCRDKNEVKQLKRIDFLTTVKQKYEVRKDLKSGEYLTFIFSKEFYLSDSDTSDYGKTLFITVPVEDTLFRFENDSTHLFRHLITDCPGLCPDIKIEEIESAVINGKLIENGVWQIEAKTKYFEFKKIVPLTLNHLEKESIKL